MPTEKSNFNASLLAFANFCRLVGLHPLVAFGMFAVDIMLFGAETALPVVTWPVSIAVATVLTIPCALIQRYGFGDRWPLAIGKALLVGLLTAIPTPLPSVPVLLDGVLGIVAMAAPALIPPPESGKPYEEA